MKSKIFILNLIIGLFSALASFAQSSDEPRQKGLRPSVTPEQVDATYDPLRNRKVNKIIMIRDIKREDGTQPQTITPNQIPAGAKVSELEPRSNRPVTNVPTDVKPTLVETSTTNARSKRSNLPPMDVPSNTSQSSSVQTNTPNGNNSTVAEGGFLPSRRSQEPLPLAGNEAPPPVRSAPVYVDTPPPPPVYVDTPPPVKQAIPPPVVFPPAIAQSTSPIPPPIVALPPAPPPTSNEPQGELAKNTQGALEAFPVAVAPLPPSDPAIVTANNDPLLPRNAIANKVDVSKNPGFVAFDQLPTGEYLDEDKYKTYFDAGWSIIIQSQQDVVADIESLRKQIGDRDNYLTTGLAMVATQQDSANIQLAELQERVKKLEEGRAPVQTDTQIYDLGTQPPVDGTANKEVPTKDKNSKDLGVELAPVNDPAKVSVKDPVKEKQLDYLIALLDDIISNTKKYLFWTGYLPEVGPSIVRLGEPKFNLNRRNLIPLSSPLGEALDPNELFAQDNSADIVAPVEKTKDPTPRIKDYDGNIRELSRDEILRMLRGKTAEASKVRVDFQVPNQTKPKAIDSPGSRKLFPSE